MGAINYFTSDYITIGVRLYDRWDLEKDSCFMEEVQEQINEYGGTVDSVINDYINDCYEADLMNVETILNKYSFYYYHVAIKPGYYEGFTINIENNFPVAFDSWEDKRAAQKEITAVKNFLLDCLGVGLVQVWPGWCTSYKSLEESTKAIKEAVKAMREEARHIPTWLYYENNIPCVRS